MSIRLIAALCLIAFIAVPAVAIDELGQSLYEKNCVNCHAANGSGRTNTRNRVLDLRSSQVQSLTDEELYDSIARGTKHREYPHGYEMRGMSKAQIKAIVAYIRTFKDKK